ncbi:MAG TPA: neprosin family prolyl endopeptidase [Verrucomicrobiae bacterium]|nr:neprosin family prolyl endopeptidase [Verrucomicrobiae bacterium]
MDNNLQSGVTSSEPVNGIPPTQRPTPLSVGRVAVQPLIVTPSIQNLSPAAQPPAANQGFGSMEFPQVIVGNLNTPAPIPAKQVHFPYVRLALAVLLLLVLSFAAFGLRQNSKSAALYNQASADIKNGRYSAAAPLLSSASKYFSLPATHGKILKLASQNQVWLSDEDYLARATALVAQKSFDDATALLAKIGKDFPGYQQVTVLQTAITSDKKLAAATQPIAKTQTPASGQATPSKAVATTQPHKTPSISTPVVGGGAAPITIPVYTTSGYNYYYAGARQFVNNEGASITFPIERPSVGQSGGSQNHSLMELAMEDNNYSTVEIGWIVDGPQFGDTLPHLFVYHFSNHATTCYNGCGFVQVSRTNYAGEALAAGTSATFKAVFSNNQWQVFYNGDEVGYFPLSSYSDNFTTATIVQVYGEVSTTGNMCIQMGNGIAGNAPGAARLSNFSLIGASASPNLSPYQTASSPYSYGSASYNGVSIGGPGSC